MCLFTEQKEPKIADKDIIVYKVGKITNKQFISPYQYYSYTKNELQREIKIHSEITHIINGYYYRVVDEGYHAYLTFRRALNSFYLIGKHIGKFIIPKGSKYYIGDDGDGDIVSSQIIYKGKINIFNKIKLLICGK